jgi:DNA-binding NarL/FixJ family response regulator
MSAGTTAEPKPVWERFGDAMLDWGGYLLLVRAIRSDARGEAVLAPSVASRLVSQLRAPEQATLSDRELEVLRLVAHGETNRGVAARLFVSEATVKTHVLHIYTKLDVNDRAAAVAAAYKRGLITPGVE